MSGFAFRFAKIAYTCGRNGLYAENIPLESSSDGLILGSKQCRRAKGNPEQYMGLFHSIVAEGNYEK